MWSPSSLGRTGRVTSQAGAARNRPNPEPAGEVQLPPRPVKPRTTFPLQKRCWWADGPARPAGAAQARGPTAHALSHKASVGLQGHRKPPLQAPHPRSSWPGVPQEQRDVGGRHPGDIQEGRRLLRPPAGKAALATTPTPSRPPSPQGRIPAGGRTRVSSQHRLGGAQSNSGSKGRSREGVRHQPCPPPVM